MTDDAQEVAFDALRQMYDEADPGISFDHALENPDEYEEGWYTDHYLASERQKEIVDEHRSTLTDKQRTAVVMTAIVGYGPSGSRENAQFVVRDEYGHQHTEPIEGEREAIRVRDEHENDPEYEGKFYISEVE